MGILTIMTQLHVRNEPVGVHVKLSKSLADTLKAGRNLLLQNLH